MVPAPIFLYFFFPSSSHLFFLNMESTLDYTLPGVLHFLQAEWRKFEREKNEWIIEKAELYVIKKRFFLHEKIKFDIGSYCIIGRRKKRY